SSKERKKHEKIPKLTLNSESPSSSDPPSPGVSSPLSTHSNESSSHKAEKIDLGSILSPRVSFQSSRHSRGTTSSSSNASRSPPPGYHKQQSKEEEGATTSFARKR